MLCRRWHYALGLGRVAHGEYKFDRRVAAGTVTLAGPLRCRGMTADVVALLGMKRRWIDTKYQGLMPRLKLLGIHFTRARRRIYAFIHDPTSGLQLPPGGKHMRRVFF